MRCINAFAVHSIYSASEPQGARPAANQRGFEWRGVSTVTSQFAAAPIVRPPVRRWTPAGRRRLGTVGSGECGTLRRAPGGSIHRPGERAALRWRGFCAGAGDGVVLGCSLHHRCGKVSVTSVPSVKSGSGCTRWGPEFRRNLCPINQISHWRFHEGCSTGLPVSSGRRSGAVRSPPLALGSTMNGRRP